jgi:hypothetical protein
MKLFAGNSCRWEKIRISNVLKRHSEVPLLEIESRPSLERGSLVIAVHIGLQVVGSVMNQRRKVHNLPLPSHLPCLVLASTFPTHPVVSTHGRFARHCCAMARFPFTNRGPRRPRTRLLSCDAVRWLGRRSPATPRHKAPNVLKSSHPLILREENPNSPCESDANRFHGRQNGRNRRRRDERRPEHR